MKIPRGAYSDEVYFRKSLGRFYTPQREFNDMAYEKKEYKSVEGEGGLWPNKKREEEPEKNHPHLTGHVHWEGKDRRLGAYSNVDGKGKKWMKIYMSEFKEKGQQAPAPAADDPFDF